MTDEHLSKEDLLREINRLRKKVNDYELISRCKDMELLQMLDGSTQGVFIYDIEKEEVYLSANWKRRMGFEHLSPKEIVLASCTCMHPDDFPIVESAYSQAIQSKVQIFNMEFRAKTIDSNYIWILGQAKIIYTPEGKPEKCFGTQIDISDRKRAEKIISLNQQRLEALLKLNQMTGNSIHELIKFAYQDAVRLTCSDIGFLGFVNEHLTEVDVYYWPGKVMDQCKVLRENLIFPLADAGIWAEAIRQNGPIVVNDYSAPHFLKKGLPEGHLDLNNLLVVPIIEKNRCVAVIAVANKDGPYNELDVLQLNLLIGGLHKIIQRCEAEEAMRKSEDRFKAFFNNCPAAMVVFWTDSLKIIDINPASENLFKYSKAEVLGRTPEELNIFPTLASKVNDSRYRLENLGSGLQEWDVKLDDGSHIRVISSVTWLKGSAKGQALASILDITDLRRMESEIAHLDRLNLIGEMAASIGHEIRNQ